MVNLVIRWVDPVEGVIKTVIGQDTRPEPVYHSTLFLQYRQGKLKTVSPNLPG